MSEAGLHTKLSSTPQIDWHLYRKNDFWVSALVYRGSELEKRFRTGPKNRFMLFQRLLWLKTSRRRFILLSHSLLSKKRTLKKKSHRKYLTVRGVRSKLGFVIVWFRQTHSFFCLNVAIFMHTPMYGFFNYKLHR